MIGSAMGCIDGVGTWALYKLSGETVTQRWLRELRDIQMNNCDIDKEKKDEAM